MGFAGSFLETEGQGFLRLRTQALWSQDIRRKSYMLLGFFTDRVGNCF